MPFRNLFSPYLNHSRFLCLLLLGLLWTPSRVFAQPNKSDSLKALLAKHPQADTIRLNLFNKISRCYTLGEITRGLPYTDSAIALAKKLHTQPELALAYYNKGYIYTAVNNYKNGTGYIRTALARYQQLHNKPYIALCYLQLAINYYAVGDYSRAFEQTTLALDAASATGNKWLIARCLNSAGLNASYLANYTLAMQYYFRQLKIYEELHDQLGIAKTLGNIGMVYYGLKKYPEAIQYTQKCLPALQRLGDKLNTAAALNNIGGFYLEMGNYQQTLNYNNKALIINRELKSRKGIANDLMDIGIASFKLKLYKRAIDSLNKAIALYDSLEAKNNLSIALGHLSGIYADIPNGELAKNGLSSSNKLAMALKLQLRSVTLARQTHDVNNEADQWKRLSTIYEHTKNYPQALTSYKTYVKLRDSISNDQKKQEINRLTLQYDFDKKEAALRLVNDRKQALARIEIARQKFILNALIAIGLVLMTAAILIFVFYKRRKDAEEQKTAAELKARIADTEMKALRLQLNPHFIFNSLNSISYYLTHHDQETADVYLVKFARLMRLILENSEHEQISLADDLLTLELYLQLEALRLEHQFSYQITITGEIDTEDTLVPPMLLQPFIENSIWHGLSLRKAGGKIRLNIQVKQQMLIFTLQDNGIGRRRSQLLQDKKLKKSSMGLKVIQARIHLINEVKQANAGVQFIDADEGTTVIISIPYQLKF